MRTAKLIIVMLLLGASSVVNNAWAEHGGHVRFGVVVDPFWGPWYYPPQSYYYPPYYPPTVVERSAPPVYIEQPSATAPAASANYWYYCAVSKSYYPYAKECPGGWQRVSPQPLAQH
ncbi:MAG TPA: hypothetical protein VIF82_00640 [Burkholderiaceae bacterium]